MATRQHLMSRAEALALVTARNIGLSAADLEHLWSNPPPKPVSEVMLYGFSAGEARRIWYAGARSEKPSARRRIAGAA